MGEKFVEARFEESSGMLLLQLRKDDVGLGDEAVEFEGRTFQPKDEVHITAIGSDLGERLKALMEDDPSAASQIRQLVDDTEWSYQLEDKWYYVAREPEQEEAGAEREESIIHMAAVPALEDFYDRLSRISGMELETPPAHVTLYTRGNPKGIGLANQAEFEERVRREVAPDELRP